MDEQMDLSESMENYLETILDLQKTNKVARAKDIADQLEVKRGTVSGALKVLKEKDLINYSPYSFITLTEEGREIAELIHQRHKVLHDFLQNVLQIEADKADKTACRMEHAIDDETLERLVAFIEYIHSCPRKGDGLLDSFIHYLKTSKLDRQKCKKCIKEQKQI
ncbi:MAG: metal-dependent transcriptional regulator [Desulfobulbaceae bacterium]|jgi:DtxR family Mn-dependent transcriptional regulator|nr:metal-dependent transcriptional regulator [Desulfobulbaceae bacterium]